MPPPPELPVGLEGGGAGLAAGAGAGLEGAGAGLFGPAFARLHIPRSPVTIRTFETFLVASHSVGMVILIPLAFLNLRILRSGSGVLTPSQCCSLFRW